MTYCALMIPKEVAPKKEENQPFFEGIKDKLMSGVKEGGFSIENATTLAKNGAKLISDNMDTITGKFSSIALTQLLTSGKMTNQSAIGYLTQGLPKAFGMTALSQGFQSVEAFQTALRGGDVNVGGVLSSLTSIGGALSETFGFAENKKNVEGYDIVELDVVINDTRSYQSDTPDRRVQSGQTYQEYIHNSPDTISLDCYLQEERRYTGSDFETLLLRLRARKLAINIVLGDETKESYVLTSFTPMRSAMGGYEYNLEFKKIQVGSVRLATLDIPVAKETPVVNNELHKDDTKTTEETSNGYKEALNDLLDVFKPKGDSIFGKKASEISIFNSNGNKGNSLFGESGNIGVFK